MIRIIPNLGPVDRGVRCVLGIACVYYGFFDSTINTNPIVASLIGIFGAVNLLASAAATCPVYTVCGVSTVKSPLAQDAGEHQD